MFIVVFMILCAGANGIHTNSFTANCENNKNTNSLFFVSTTFGHTLPNKCEIVTNSGYRQMMNDKMTCVGEHCVDQKFGCLIGNSRDCYNVEHIIDDALSQRYICKSDTCNANIVGNRVMSWGLWNQEIGTLGGNDQYFAFDEKNTVYGQSNIKEVVRAMESCNMGCHCEYVEPISSETIVAIISISVTVLVTSVIIGIIYVVIRTRQTDKRKFIQLQGGQSPP